MPELVTQARYILYSLADLRADGILNSGNQPGAFPLSGLSSNKDDFLQSGR